MNQEMLDRMIGAAPPSTVDVDEVIGRTRRRQRFRRAATGGVAAAVAAFAVLVAVNLAGRPPRPVPVVQVPAAPSASSGPLIEVDTPAGRARTLARLGTVLEAAVESHAPGTRWIYMPDVPGEKRLPDGHPAMWVTEDPVSFQARSGITGGGRKGGFYLSLRAAGCAAMTSCSPLYECDGTVPVCESTRISSGLTLVHYVDKPGKSRVFYGTDVELRGGKYALRMLAVNYFGGDGAPAVAPVPVLTRDQLDAVAAEVAERFSD
ncbi:hypothetical protein AB0M02_21110 [Actinoplanes sp. NPDC051861]|uniref:hypothetical protein n=1 Tax=Actinoplanes sp. NPDC051861 TaxID=3155170 RepID=UPI00341D9D92